MILTAMPGTAATGGSGTSAAIRRRSAPAAMRTVFFMVSSLRKVQRLRLPDVDSRRTVVLPEELLDELDWAAGALLER